MADDPRNEVAQFTNPPTFRRSYRLYVYVLPLLDPIADPYVRVMGVSRHGRRFYLHINVEFFRKNPRFLHGVLLHEVHHLVLGHLAAERFRDVVHADLMELAMEISANEFIREPLPGRPIVWSDYRAFGIRPSQRTSDSRHHCPGRGNVSRRPPRGMGSTVAVLLGPRDFS
jgi:hypothetical protein